nr:DUF1016 N-terminal domain-containing protein [Burkholderia sp. GbtcB21]
MTTATYWEIGRRIVAFEQGGEGRAAYGKAVIRHLGADLPECLGRGFGWWNLAQMRAFYLTWPVDRIVQTLPAKSTTAQIVPTPSAKSAKPSKATANRTLEPSTVARAFPLTWSAYVRLLSVKTSAARDFYETEALREGWSVRQLGRSTRPPRRGRNIALPSRGGTTNAIWVDQYVGFCSLFHALPHKKCQM